MAIGPATDELGELYAGILMGSVVHELSVIRAVAGDLAAIDWAETWAHYLHISDTSQTAAGHGMRTQLAAPGDVAELGFRQTLRDWIPFTFAMNGICRSMGIPDLYPFVLTPAVIEKLLFVDEAVHAAVGAAATGPD